MSTNFDDYIPRRADDDSPVTQRRTRVREPLVLDEYTGQMVTESVLAARLGDRSG